MRNEEHLSSNSQFYQNSNTEVKRCHLCFFSYFPSKFSWWTTSPSIGQKKTDWIPLTHWGRVTHICVNKLTIIGSDNGLSPGRRQAIIRTNAGILLIWHFSEILIEIWIFSFKKMHLKNVVWKMATTFSRPQCVKWTTTSSEWLKYRRSSKFLCDMSFFDHNEHALSYIFLVSQKYSPDTNNAF